jgi:hypothetical protein
MPQEELHRFPQRGFSKDTPRCHEAFQFRRRHRLDRLRVIRQFSKNLLRYALCLGFIREVLLNPPSRLIKGELVHRLTAIDRLIEFDCLLTVRDNCRHILYGGVSTKLHLLCIPLCKNQSLT